jgi:hypothetical protein
MEKDNAQIALELSAYRGGGLWAFLRDSRFGLPTP